jgi:hypothetical protein
MLSRGEQHLESVLCERRTCQIAEFRRRNSKKQDLQ